MDFQVIALDAMRFQPLFGLADAALAAQGVERVRVDASPGFPCRVGLRDPAVGATVLLLNFEHLPGATPYRSRHAIFVEEGATSARPPVNTVGAYLSQRLLSVRAFDAADRMRDADVCAGIDAESLFRRLLADPSTAYLHVHTARRGCYLAEVRRA